MTGGGRAEDRGLSLVVSYRTEGPYREAVRPPVAALGELRGSARTIEIASLPGEAVESWLHMALPGASEEIGRRIAGEMKGHPFLIRQIDARPAALARGGFASVGAGAADEELLEAIARKLGIRVRALYDRLKRLQIGKRDRGG